MKPAPKLHTVTPARLLFLLSLLLLAVQTVVNDVGGFFYYSAGLGLRGWAWEPRGAGAVNAQRLLGASPNFARRNAICSSCPGAR